MVAFQRQDGCIVHVLKYESFYPLKTPRERQLVRMQLLVSLTRRVTLSQDGKEMLRNFETPNPRTYNRTKGYLFPKGHTRECTQLRASRLLCSFPPCL